MAFDPKTFIGALGGKHLEAATNALQKKQVPTAQNNVNGLQIAALSPTAR